MLMKHWLAAAILLVVGYFIGSKYPTLIPIPKIGG